MNHGIAAEKGEKVIGVFAFLIVFVSPAHALRVVGATVALGEVQVVGIQANKSTNITWEGNIVTQSNKLGAFQFSTPDLPHRLRGAAEV